MKFFASFARTVATILLSVPLPCAGILGFRMLPVAPLPQVDFPVIVVSASLPVRHQKQWRLPLPRRWSAHLGALPELVK
ncbi:efflux RND transporter permease subunit [Shigella flexneri]